MHQANESTAMSDEQLDFWGDFFVRNRAHFRACGVLFETFIQHPRDIAESMLFRPLAEERENFWPLLPAQRRAIAKPGARYRAISRPLTENICIGCGCTDSHGCLTTIGVCHWERLDSARHLGVCSECRALVTAWDEARQGGAIPDKTTGQIMAAACAAGKH